MIGYTYQMKENTMLNVKQIMELFGCGEAYAKNIEASMAALGFDFSGSSQEEFNAMATEVFHMIQQGIELV